jgi:hypothetical protein
MDEIELRLAGTLPPSNVTFRKLRIRWQESKQRIAAELTKLRASVETEFGTRSPAAPSGWTRSSDRSTKAWRT